jgi:hypothetical protein
VSSVFYVIVPALIESLDLQKIQKLLTCLTEGDLLKQENFADVISETQTSLDKATHFITQRIRLLLETVCSNVSLKNIEHVFDIITPFMEG